MAIFLEVSAAPERILLSEISYAPVQHSPPESFIVRHVRNVPKKFFCLIWGMGISQQVFLFGSRYADTVRTNWPYCILSLHTSYILNASIGLQCAVQGGRLVSAI